MRTAGWFGVVACALTSCTRLNPGFLETEPGAAADGDDGGAAEASATGGETRGDGTGDGTTGGDGDGPTTGDGDGDGPTSGDGDGDGPTSGDGDGTSGDGDGTTTTGDGDGTEDRYVFVTSWSGPGDFGGFAFADDVCNLEASEAGLPGSYKAWLSENDVGPLDRFTTGGGRYKLPNGQTAAESWALLIVGSLTYPISVVADGTPVGGTLVWTGTSADGLPAPGQCEAWTSTVVGAMTGATNSNLPAWTADAADSPCSWQGHLYCFQQ